ncbi:hypothetical protein [Vreelandella populi]|uniref:hypothetical protein n=1 Tax=Vreelandella populi TaxID=2498858 RepID=UPI000F8E8C7C|nr:hypothetical protein [Halomonas populi]RUR52010.1 hypothetical protein ELY40_14960 [Halomonas populi]
MNNNLFVGIVGAMSAMVSPMVVAEAGARLFQNWHYGQHIDEFPRSQGYYDCKADVGVLTLCHDDVLFLQSSFTGVFTFSNEGKLASITVATYFSDDLYIKLMGALTRNF